MFASPNFALADNADWELRQSATTPTRSRILHSGQADDVAGKPKE
jgi:hypothetical protein